MNLAFNESIWLILKADLAYMASRDMATLDKITVTNYHLVFYERGTNCSKLVVVGRLRLPTTPDSTHLVIIDLANPDSTPI
jgi:hypothetical protein